MNEALDALYALDPGMAREQWVRVAFAAKDAGITEEDWLAWCAGGANFNNADATSTYRNAKPRAGGVTSATLYMMARDAGWKPEARKGGNGANGGNGNGEHHHAEPQPRAPRAAPKPAEPEPAPTDPRPVWDACAEAKGHGYTERKRIGAHGARVSTSGWLVVPYINRERALQTLQYIGVDGTKRFLAGARQKGSVALVGEPEGAGIVVVAEGFATAAAIHEASGYPAIVSGSRGTMVEAAKIARHFAPQARVVIAADRGDLSTPTAAARAVEGFLAVPGPEDAPEGFDFADWRLSGVSDAELAARIAHAPPVPIAEPTPAKAPAAQAAVATAIAAPGPVAVYLTDAKGRPMANLHNIAGWLSAGNAGRFALDRFTGLVTWDGAPMEEHTYPAVTVRVQAALVDGKHPFTKAAVATVVDGIQLAAQQNIFNSCVDWLESIGPWDNTPRIERFLADVCGLDATDYLMAASRYLWLGMVSRMVLPGTKVDSAVVLVGPQGIGKTQLAHIIGGERAGEIGLAHIGERDWCAQLRGKIIVEIAELAGHSRAELESIKAVISRSHDEYRMAYARTATTFARGCVFLGTTNENDFLMDQGGNRRWLPVDCSGPFNLDAARTMREDCFREAYALVKAGLSPTWHVIEGADKVQDEHVAVDPWVEYLGHKLRDVFNVLPPMVTNKEVYEALEIPAERRHGGGTGRRINAVMRVLGYKRVRDSLKRGFELEPKDQ